MFATLRTEEADGEVVCISSTHLPPAPGQNTNHFACDGCRAKKLKCTGHRFGCQRCRDRNLVCSYTNASQPRRRRTGGPAAQRRTPACGTPTSSNPEESMIPSYAPQEEEKSRISSHSLGSAEDKGNSCIDAHIPSHATNSKDTHILNPPTQPSIDSTDSSNQLSAETDTISAISEFPELMIPDYIEPGMHEFDMDELLEADLALSDHDTSDFGLESTFTSSTSSEYPSNSDASSSRESSFAISSSSGDVNWNSTRQHKSKRALEDYSPVFVPAKRASTSMSFNQRTTAPNSPSTDLKVAGSPAIEVEQLRQSREITSTRRRTRTSQISSCRCIGITLGHLEKIQGHTKVATLCSAEKSLNSLKRSISQCKTLSQCRSCRSPSRVMTFLILLIEKMTGILEDIAAVWETNSLASASEQNSEQMDVYGHAHRWLPIHIGQYQIDTIHERCEVFGFLVTLQVRQLLELSISLRLSAEREHWESHQTAIRPVALRLHDLHEALRGTPPG